MSTPVSLWTALLLGLALLSGCGSAPPINPPKPLAALQPQLQMETLWRVQHGDGADGHRLSLPPARDAQNLYVVDRHGVVGAYDLVRGEPQWLREIEQKVSTGPGVGSGLVVLATVAGDLLALDASTGEVRWRQALQAELLAPAQIHAGRLYLHAGDGSVRALSISDGEELWRHQRKPPVLTLRGSSRPQVVDGRVYVGLDTGEVVALAADSGRVIWEQQIATPRGRSELERLVDVDAQLLIQDGRLFAAAYQHLLVGLSLTSGSQLWERKLSLYRTPAADQSRLFAIDADSRVHGIELRNGRVIWQQEALLNRNLTAPARVKDGLLTADYEGYVHVLGLSDGRLLGRLRLSETGFEAPPLAVDERIYLYSLEGELSALRILP